MTNVEDEAIIGLYIARDEAAISATERKYSHYLTKVADNILRCFEDAEECVNDTMAKAWDSIPPERPENLRAFLSRITQRGAITIHRAKTAKKRGGGGFAEQLDELSDMLSGGDDTVSAADSRLLGAAIDRFLREQKPLQRQVFVRRYYTLDSMEKIAGEFRLSVANTKNILFRQRKKLKIYLTKEGFEL